MKKFLLNFVVCAMVCILAISCESKQEAPVPAPAPEVVEPAYQPQHSSVTLALNNLKTYNYVAAPDSVPAVSVVVDYGKPYTKPTTITFSYANGDTRAVVLPKDFGIWNNSVGRPRVIYDEACTVWIQGQTKRGKFCEFVFYGDPKYNGKKIKPNSYRNLPAGEIKYRK